MTTAPERDVRPLTQEETLSQLGRYEYGWADSDTAGASAQRGLNEAVVRDISAKKSEPQWMLDRRVKALSIFDKKPMPTWGSDLSGIDFDNIKYFVRSTEKQAAAGVQICQHHCPVAHVAAEFPELCEAETRAFEQVLGTYVQRLATIAHGDGVCTTHVPTQLPTPSGRH